MSEEEKKAIEKIKELRNLKIYFTSQYFASGNVSLDEEGKKTIDIILKLIEKQQKEIETLKQNKVIKTLKELSDYDIKIMSEECGKALTPVILDEMKRQIKTDYIPKQKIRDKIEELKNEYEYLSEENKRVNKFEIELLEELLVEE